MADEERVENDVAVHKHDGYEWWHPASRIHKKESEESYPKFPVEFSPGIICDRYKNGCSSIPGFKSVESYEKKSSRWYRYVSCDRSIKHCGWCPVQEVRRGRAGYDDHFPSPLTGKIAAYW